MKERINRYKPGIISNVKDFICDRFGHRNVWGPRNGDGQTICVFCNTHLGYHRFGNFQKLAEALCQYEKSPPETRSAPRHRTTAAGQNTGNTLELDL
jgi:hypothetical protein